MGISLPSRPRPGWWRCLRRSRACFFWRSWWHASSPCTARMRTLVTIEHGTRGLITRVLLEVYGKQLRAVLDNVVLAEYHGRLWLSQDTPRSPACPVPVFSHPPAPPRSRTPSPRVAVLAVAAPDRGGNVEK